MSVLQISYPDGTLWLDFRNKFDLSGLLLRERLQDLLCDLAPPGSEDAAIANKSLQELQQLFTSCICGKACLIVLDNLHSSDKGTISFYAKLQQSFKPFVNILHLHLNLTPLL